MKTITSELGIRFKRSPTGTWTVIVRDVAVGTVWQRESDGKWRACTKAGDMLPASFGTRSEAARELKIEIAADL